MDGPLLNLLLEKAVDHFGKVVPMKMLRDHKYPNKGFFESSEAVLQGKKIPFELKNIEGKFTEDSVFQYAVK